MTGETVLEVRDLHTYLFPRRGAVKAVDPGSFALRRGETLGLVGRIRVWQDHDGALPVAPAATASSPHCAWRGTARRGGFAAQENLQMRRIRGRKIAMILQDPQTSLNPVLTVGNQLIEAIARHRPGPRRTLLQRAIEALRRVQVAEPVQRIRDYPHQMSGGMKQRVVGAIAISCEPLVLVADEPTTALDATIQLQYLKLLETIRAQTQMAILFITHDFGVVAGLCDRVAVMYAGRIVETGPVRQVFSHPAHPYTQALLASVPRMTQRPERLPAIAGQPPTSYDVLPPGCRFAPRCPFVDDRCLHIYPPAFTRTAEHTAHCWRLESA